MKSFETIYSFVAFRNNQIIHIVSGQKGTIYTDHRNSQSAEFKCAEILHIGIIRYFEFGLTIIG